MIHQPDEAQQRLLFEIATSCRCNNLRQAARAATTFYNYYMAESGLTAAQCPLLVVLMLAGPQQIQVLADQLGLDRTTLTRNLRVLVGQGYVAIAPGRDQRTRVAAITEAGRAVLLAVLPRWQEAQAAFTAALGATSSTALFDACRLAAALAPEP
ncbi:MAG: MarR family winged helix-turn-helix transcriptional regulator [Chloroflexaceae bacterium]|jgi:DNA-binding MarR family transcriptional regulator|nr:MarR family winged helix-turn-helix transcriptional regulator [Chloroflexaceae bacterium]